MQDKLLVIFVKNPELGKVKTRLAKETGKEKALEIYQELLDHTRNVACNTKVDKAVYYSDFIDEYDSWNNTEFQKFKQEGKDLGARMKNAFDNAFSRKYNKVVIIGSDCFELSSALVDEAFYILDNKDVVVGPAKDGGYYLLGMKTTHPDFFSNKAWSSEDVFLDTLLDIEKLKLSYQLLDTLSDIDHAADLSDANHLSDY